MVAHPTGLLDHGRNATGGPDLAPEAPRLRALGQQHRQVGALLGRELGLGTGREAAPQAWDATLAHTRQPLADRARRDAQRGGDQALRPALLLELPRPQPAPFPPIPR